MGLPLNGMATQDLMDVLLVSRNALECNAVDELIHELLRHLEGIFKTGNSNFFLTRHLAQALNLDRVITRGIDDKFIKRFREYYYRLSPFLKRLPPAGTTVLTTEQLISFKKLIRCEYYNDFLKPQSIHYQMSIFLKSEQRLLGVLSLFRPRNARNFSSLDKAKADLMAPYLAGALEKSMTSERIVEQKSIIDSIVAGLPYEGIIVMDGSLEVIYQNENAIEFLSNLNKAARGRQTFHSFLPKEIYEPCKQLITSAHRRGTSKHQHHRFYLASPAGQQRLSVHLRIITHCASNPLLLLGFDSKEEKLSLIGRLRRLGLTRREVDLVLLLSKGLTNREIGRKLFISEYTVENHLRSIYRKMDVTNRTAVVHRLLQMTSNESLFTDEGVISNN